MAGDEPRPANSLSLPRGMAERKREKMSHEAEVSVVPTVSTFRKSLVWAEG